MSPLNLIMSPQDDDDDCQRNRTHPCCLVVRVAELLHLQERLVALREQTPLPQSATAPPASPGLKSGFSPSTALAVLTIYGCSPLSGATYCSQCLRGRVCHVTVVTL